MKIKYYFVGYLIIADMAQSVEHNIGSVEVTGSIPVISFIFLMIKNSQSQ